MVPMGALKPCLEHEGFEGVATSIPSGNAILRSGSPRTAGKPRGRPTVSATTSPPTATTPTSGRGSARAPRRGVQEPPQPDRAGARPRVADRPQLDTTRKLIALLDAREAEPNCASASADAARYAAFRCPDVDPTHRQLAQTR